MTSRLARDPARRCLPLKDWPDPDRQLWLAAIRPGSPLRRGPRARLAPRSNSTVEKSYGKFLAWLACEELLDAAIPPAARITEEVTFRFLQHLETINSTVTQHRRLVDLQIAAAVMDPRTDWRWLRQLAAEVRWRMEPSRDKRPRIVGIDDLEQLGQELMRRADEPGSPRKRALLFRDGLIICLLAARPFRRDNFAALRFGMSVEQRGGSWWLRLSRKNTKGGRPFEVPFPGELLDALQTYLKVHRPVLIARSSRWTEARPPDEALWVSHRGTAMGSQALYDLTVAHTRRAFGRGVNPHLFRDCAATFVALEDPEHVRIAAPLLGHASLETTNRYYIQASTVEAARRYQQNMARRRRERAARKAAEGL